MNDPAHEEEGLALLASVAGTPSATAVLKSNTARFMELLASPTEPVRAVALTAARDLVCYPPTATLLLNAGLTGHLVALLSDPAPRVLHAVWDAVASTAAVSQETAVAFATPAAVSALMAHQQEVPALLALLAISTAQPTPPQPLLDAAAALDPTTPDATLACHAIRAALGDEAHLSALLTALGDDSPWTPDNAEAGASTVDLALSLVARLVEAAPAPLLTAAGVTALFSSLETVAARLPANDVPEAALPVYEAAPRLLEVTEAFFGPALAALPDTAASTVYPALTAALTSLTPALERAAGYYAGQAEGLGRPAWWVGQAVDAARLLVVVLRPVVGEAVRTDVPAAPLLDLAAHLLQGDRARAAPLLVAAGLLIDADIVRMVGGDPAALPGLPESVVAPASALAPHLVAALGSGVASLAEAGAETVTMMFHYPGLAAVRDGAGLVQHVEAALKRHGDGGRVWATAAEWVAYIKG